MVCIFYINQKTTIKSWTNKSKEEWNVKISSTQIRQLHHLSHQKKKSTLLTDYSNNVDQSTTIIDEIASMYSSK